ncbi:MULTISPECIES: threonine synthase [unclassified Photobacterium]|uniref:threonine synthase n=1 Tax=unclassified Photobacterium TaxID=2628852 RepID=UPI000D15C2DE|nr:MULTISPECIES: threonine synthase [unclassified Photobacterium]PSV31067.1 threonine synthase [Photobacterium sp. GB-72]PSV36981.1 threonine synthase [Photobacterium sp. GB-210]PSV44007.1 threonine synthase [Photobacterium sp. GB-36]PSV52616.1 threonine synthase [Photobacterium sp. GB-1]PSW72851.1 threonine synthase [Photobacterium sp. GB-50]
MKLYNLKEHQEQVSFGQAVRQGLGRNQGLFFPSELPQFSDIDALLEMDFVTRSSKILSAFIGDELSEETVSQMVDSAFQFPAPINKVKDGVYALELFHGPTLAFKDFGGRFMAQSLAAVTADSESDITILTATSGDTGAAVAHAFYGMDNIKVVILYPKGKISPLQEKMFCTLGKNITTVAVNGTFDDCQALVKQAFDDAELRKEVGLNSANSINISRLMAQICYYFEAVAQLPKAEREQLVISVPSGNFGNLTAGLLAKSLGLPVKRFIAATNENDTVPRYLQTGEWSPKVTVPTISNAMDVSQPNNWPRIEELCQLKGWGLNELGYGAVTDEQTAETLKQMNEEGYLCEPHGAIAYRILNEQLNDGETGLFLCTAHPAKFKEVVDEILDKDIPLPAPLAKHNAMELLSLERDNDFEAVKAVLRSVQ